MAILGTIASSDVCDLTADIVPSRADHDKVLMVLQFRLEILQKWIRETSQQHGTSMRIPADEFSVRSLETLIAEQNGKPCKPRLDVHNILGHDWQKGIHRSVYTVNVNGKNQAGTAGELQELFSGVPWVCWESWGGRTRVKSWNIERHFDVHGSFGFFRYIMWPLLETEDWLMSWRIYRTTRRG
jgi:hypothetical protein